MRVLILGDSLVFPQPSRGQPLHTTWPVLLKEALPSTEVWQRAKPRHCIKDVFSELHFFTESLSLFDAVIIQSGIVDCSPRPYPHWFYRMIEIFISRTLLRKIERFTHRRLLWTYGRPWVSSRRFADLAKEIICICAQFNPAIKVIFIAIAPPTKSLAQLLPGVAVAAERYNKALNEKITMLSPNNRCFIVDPFTGENPLSVTIDDGQHLTCNSHKRIADMIRLLL